MTGNEKGATLRQDDRSIAAGNRRPRHSIAATRDAYDRACRIAGIIIGLCFGVMFALGIIAG